jgi:hypothetical protein
LELRCAFGYGATFDNFKAKNMCENNWGGKRSNQTGRPPIEDRRIRRGLAFNSAEWQLIKTNAERRGLSIREYLFSLAEKDGQ